MINLKALVDSTLKQEKKPSVTDVKTLEPLILAPVKKRIAPELIAPQKKDNTTVILWGIAGLLFVYALTTLNKN